MGAALPLSPRQPDSPTWATPPMDGHCSLPLRFVLMVQSHSHTDHFLKPNKDFVSQLLKKFIFTALEDF